MVFERDGSKSDPNISMCDIGFDSSRLGFPAPTQTREPVETQDVFSGKKSFVELIRDL